MMALGAPSMPIFARNSRASSLLVSIRFRRRPGVHGGAGRCVDAVSGAHLLRPGLMGKAGRRIRPQRSRTHYTDRVRGREGGFCVRVLLLSVQPFRRSNSCSTWCIFLCVAPHKRTEHRWNLFPLVNATFCGARGAVCCRYNGWEKVG